MTSQGRRHPAAPTSTPATGWAQVSILVPLFRRYRTPLEFVKIQVVHTRECGFKNAPSVEPGPVSTPAAKSGASRHLLPLMASAASFNTLEVGAGISKVPVPKQSRYASFIGYPTRNRTSGKCNTSTTITGESIARPGIYNSRVVECPRPWTIAAELSTHPSGADISRRSAAELSTVPRAVPDISRRSTMNNSFPIQTTMRDRARSAKCVGKVGGMELTIPLLVSWMPAYKAAPITAASGESRRSRKKKIPNKKVPLKKCEVPLFRRYRTPLEFVKIQVVHTRACYTNGSTRTATSHEYLRQRQLRAAGACGKVNCELRITASVVSAIRPRMMPDAEGPSLTPCSASVQHADIGLGAINLDGQDAGEVCLFYAFGSAFSLAWSDSSSGESAFCGAAGVLGYVSSSSTMPRVTPAQRVGDSAGMHEGSLEKSESLVDICVVACRIWSGCVQLCKLFKLLQAVASSTCSEKLLL
ncbi:hypothetical protein B0H13DRAFT_1927316 [Mycena leptocephala]|nr:hypothetical protein B0H13DRAFT_1927316 [Mycena leptocephala]